MGDGSGKLDVTHSLAAHLLCGDLDSALFADLALIADALVLSAEAFPVLGRTEDPLAEQTVALCLEGTVIDGLRLFYLAVRPASYHFRRRKPDFY